MNWLEQTIKATIFAASLGVLYVTINDVMVKFESLPITTHSVQ